MHDDFENVPRDQDELYAMIQDCVERLKKLTEWERQFIDSIDRQICDKMLTEKQIETLDRIWDRIT